MSTQVRVERYQLLNNQAKRTPLLVASLIAISATEPAKKLGKRGLIGGNNDLDALGVDSSAKYLPPVSTLTTSVRRPYVVSSVPSSSYDLPSYSVPQPTYGVPAYSAPVVAPVPSYSAPVSVPAPTYGVPVSAPLPTFSASAPVSVPSSSYGVPSLSPVQSASTLTASLPLSTGPVSVPSTSYGVPSTVVQSVPSVGVSLNSASYPSQTSSHVSAGGLSLSSFSLPVRSNGVSSYSSGFASGSVSSSLSAAPADDGYSYPAPSKQLLV
ncbi:hypothetical protein WN51_12178 [Melipona quadrifasciata]|uniref:Uncharacterized protein n=1 Tax=Melipona quadrifasciata TaxID=166423 RepID=A0A0N0BGX6_9HYME|nr:hypothetical protein WN51_12178 [Melipona quadrifasciata]